MSLVLFNTSDALTAAIETATGRMGIVMLCSTADDGNNYQVVYPASHPSVLAIAACNAFGKVTQWSNQTAANFVFQGEDIVTTVRKGADGRAQVSGSSVATAMAAGAVSLIMACHRINEQVQRSRRGRQTNVVVQQILGTRMMENTATESRYVQPKLFFATPDEMPLGSPRAFANWLAQNFQNF